MEPYSIFSILESVAKKPGPFSKYTANELWTDEYTSKRMLEYHLNGDVDVSSRRTSFIDDSVAWMTDRFALCERSKIIDFGCGPGLYTSRFAKLGAEVCGVDFSARSIAYAKEQAKQANNQISYIEADYLEYEPDGTFDLATMIMCDYSVLAPGQRAAMLAKFRGLLSAEGRIVLDVYSLRAFESKQEESVYGKDLMDGFWSPDPYFCFITSFKYGDDKVSLDKYTIVERERVREVYNWFQYYSPESLKHEASIAGLEVEALIGDVAGHSYDAAGMEFAVVLKAAPVFHQN
jgi:SAM-dependent methyltransferase